MAELMSGRLVTDGTGKMYIQPVDDEGNTVLSLHLVGEDGESTEELIPDLVEVRWDEASGGFVRVLPGEKSHNETHEQNVLTIDGTTGPLYDADGNLVVAGDPHHDEPLPDDPHYDPDAPGKTTLQTIPDDISPVATSHTEAYTK